MKIPAVLLACGLALGAYALNAHSQTGLPDGWAIGGEAPKLFAADVDTGDSPSGKGSVVMRRTETSHPYGGANLMQSFAPEAYAGKRVRLRAHVRFLGSANREGGGKIMIAPNDASYSQSNKGFDHEWTWYEATVTLPADLKKLAIGVNFKGPGSAKVDAIDLEVMGEAAPGQQAPRIDDIVQHEDPLPRATP